MKGVFFSSKMVLVLILIIFCSNCKREATKAAAQVIQSKTELLEVVKIPTSDTAENSIDFREEPPYPDKDFDTISAEEKEFFVLELFQKKSPDLTNRNYSRYDIFSDFQRTLGSTYRERILQEDVNYPFGELNPLFLEWFRRQFPIPQPDKKLNILSTLSYGEIYAREHGVRSDMRLLAAEYAAVKQKEASFRRIANEYIKNLPSDHLLEDINTIQIDYDQMARYGIYDSNIKIRAFWVRRMIDGSFNALWMYLKDILRIYDAQWLHDLESAAPYIDTIDLSGTLSSNLKIRTEGALEADTIDILQKDSRVQILARGDQKDTIDDLSGYWYLIKNELVRGWAFGPYIDIDAAASSEGLLPFLYSLTSPLTEDQFYQSMGADTEENRRVYFYQAYLNYKTYEGVDAIEEKIPNLTKETDEYTVNIRNKDIPLTGINLSNETYRFNFLDFNNNGNYMISIISENITGSSSKQFETLEYYLGAPETNSDHPDTFIFPLTENSTQMIGSDQYGEMNFAQSIGLRIIGDNSYTMTYRFYLPIP